MKESFIFYNVYFQAIEKLGSSKRKLKLYEAICRYCLLNELPNNLDNEEQAIFILIRFINDNYSILTNKDVRHSPAYTIWRKNVLKRDNFTCQICGKTGDEISLHAHHINKFSLNKDERFNLDNGITLCQNCHKNIHKGVKCQLN